MKIQKLDLQDVYSKIDFVSISAMAGKIDELVDAVNELQEHIKFLDERIKTKNFMIDIEKTNPISKHIDPYAEQRKWLGKLCKFWDGDEQMSHLCWGILYTITPTSPVPYCCSLGDGKTFDYEHCEPVKPDDDIIYKGENVEPADNSEKANCQGNMQPDYVTTTYMTDGLTKEYYGQNGASIVTDNPLPAGYVITIREPENEGGDNE